MTTRDLMPRPWGGFMELASVPGAKVKVLQVHPGQRISLQQHAHRSEHWVVLQGCGLVSIGSWTFEIGAGEHCHVPKGQPHRLTNTGAETLQVIEIQLGEELTEEDIQRFEDDYGRA